MAEITPTRRFVDMVETVFPVWLRNRPGFGTGYRVCASIASVCDALLDICLTGLQAGYPGRGTPTALPYIGRSRGIIRGEDDTDEEYQAKLIAWLDTWEDAGSAEVIARVLWEYLEDHPRIRVIQRPKDGPASDAEWLTIETNGTVVREQGPWDWDSVSHPERWEPDNYHWSDLWVIVYPTPYAQTEPGNWGTGVWGLGNGFGLGHAVPRESYDAVKGLLSQWKAAHSKIVAVLWTTDSDAYGPSGGSPQPDGTWGSWGTTGTGARVPSNRDLTATRYWHP